MTECVVVQYTETGCLSLVTLHMVLIVTLTGAHTISQHCVGSALTLTYTQVVYWIVCALLKW